MTQPRYVRTKEQRVADAEAKLAKAKLALSKAERAADTRRKVIIGGAMLARADGGDADAARVVEEIKGALTRAQDRAVFGLSPVRSAQDWADEVLAARDANLAAQKVEDKQAQGESHVRWREAILNWERLEGRLWVSLEDPTARSKHGMGGIGELLHPGAPR
jgi:hypothetical protein